MLMKAGAWWLKITEFDLRSLAFVRISVGLLLVWMQFNYILQADLFFSDSGVCTRSAVALMRTANKFPSMHKFSGDADAVRVLLALGVLAGVALTLGWKTRTITVVAWLLSRSSHARCPYMLQGSDTELDLILFFMIFLPWGRVWSLDALRKERPESYGYRSWANSGVLLQIAMIYIFAVLLKITIDTDWTQGTSVFYALHSGSRAKDLGDLLLDAPIWVLQLLSRASLLFELIGPFLLLAGTSLRLLGVFSFALMHWCFGLCLTLGTFAWISPTAAAAALPSAFWDWIERRCGRTPLSAPPVIRKFAWSDAVVGGALLLSLHMNSMSLLTGEPNRLQRAASWFGQNIGFSQKWAMFTTIDRKDFGYFRIVGLQDGKLHSLFEERELASVDDLPARGSATYPSMEWRRLLLSFIRDTKYQSVGFMGPGLCRLLGDKAKDGVQIWQHYRPLSYPEKRPPYRKRLILDYSCADQDDRYEFRLDSDGGAYSFPLREIGAPVDEKQNQ